ncbi:carbohydrate kinase family protein [Agrobacterium tumefaciens]|uniref:Sugar kinase n=1 Tax=Agrobacterium tumefaciens TaxID=358 RepID=A0AA44FE67_AGRTU|nr:sugar kinase [Agrobacterium tumefaciens]NTC17159.1 sugar kinase [Agrobacterium tumefaciens]NTC32421.1 sugar kinase [Agrobacterium tumefaciens]
MTEFVDAGPWSIINGQPRILIIGDIMLDVIVKPSGPIVLGSDRQARIETHAGGSAANQAAWVAHFGGDVTFVAKVGRNDVASHQATFVKSGVTPILAVDESADTGVLITLVDPDGQRSFLTDRAANQNLDVGDLPDSILDQVAILHLSGYSFFSTRSRAAVSDIVRRAKAKGVLITVDPGSAGFLAEGNCVEFFEWTKDASVCFPNSDEARVLAGSEQPDVQRRVLNDHYPLVIIKRGELGAEACVAGKVLVKLSAPKVEVVDTTGAGDAFLAGFLTALSKKQSLETALSAAIEAGSTATINFGGRPPSR